MDISKLSKEERDALKAQLDAEEQAEKDRVINERINYKSLVNTTVNEHIKKLANASSQLAILKADVYNSFTTIIELKNELYGSKSGQQSHTFTDDSGKTITIGFRVIENFDDTLDMGIAKIREYLISLAVDDNSAKLVDMINRLLKKDAKGNLKANRIIELQALADEIKSPLFSEGVKIVREAYKPQRSAIFIEAESKDELGKKISIPLAITAVDFPEGFEPNLEVFK